MDGKTFLVEDEYTYRGRNTYLLDQYIEQVTFAKYQVQRQMEYALERRKQLKFEVQAFAIALAAYLVVFYLANSITRAAGTLLFVAGQVVSTILSMANLFFVPACLFKIARGSIILLTDNSEVHAALNSSVRIYQAEIRECQMYLEKYRLLLEDLYQWKREVMQGGEIEEDRIHGRMQGINLKPDIQVALDGFGKMGGFYTTLAIAVTAFICFLIVMLS